MTYIGYVWGGVFTLGVGAAIIAGAGSASAESTDAGAGPAKSASAETHATHTAGSRRATAANTGALRVQKQGQTGLLTSSRRDGKATSARPVARVRAAAAAVQSVGVPKADLPASYQVTGTFVDLLRASNVEVTGTFTGPADAEFYALYLDASRENIVGYTRLYVGQKVSIPRVTATQGYDVLAFDPGAFPGDFDLPEIPSGPPRRLPNSSAEDWRESTSSTLSLIPGVAQVVGAVSLVWDGIELLDAYRRGDADDVYDEQFDLAKDAINTVFPFGIYGFLGFLIVTGQYRFI